MTSSSKTPCPQFPNHAEPRVWFITSASCPIGLAVTQEALNHGDFVIAGEDLRLLEADNGIIYEPSISLRSIAESEEWEGRLKIVRTDPRCEKKTSNIF